MRFRAIIGETGTPSSPSRGWSYGWGRITVRGTPLSPDDAVLKERLPELGEWYACEFDVPEGTIVEWDAGVHTPKQKYQYAAVLRAKSPAPHWHSGSIGHPSHASLEGHFVVISEEITRGYGKQR